MYAMDHTVLRNAPKQNTQTRNMYASLVIKTVKMAAQEAGISLAREDVIPAPSVSRQTEKT